MQIMSSPETIERPSRAHYARCNAFLNTLKKTPRLTYQQRRTLWGQAVHGDLDGAQKGYDRIMQGKRL